MGIYDIRNYCKEAETAEKDDAFSKSKADFNMIMYADIVAASASTFRAPTPLVP